MYIKEYPERDEDDFTIALYAPLNSELFEGLTVINWCLQELAEYILGSQ